MSLGLAILSCALSAGTCHAGAPGVRAFAVRVTAPAGTLVRLSALDVPRGWSASFCTPRVCSPRRVTVPVRGGGAAIQLSYAPIGSAAAPLHALHVAARSGAARSDARLAVAR
jgi:hypothetical protein